MTKDEFLVKIALLNLKSQQLNTFADVDWYIMKIHNPAPSNQFVFCISGEDEGFKKHDFTPNYEDILKALRNDPTRIYN